MRRIVQAVVCVALLAESVLASEYRVFTRRVGELTGALDHPARVRGQDSPVLFEWQGRVHFLFGDTIFHDGRLFHPNSMAWTTDFDAEDGVELTYHRGNRHRPVLPSVPGEFSVWLNGAYVLDGDVFANYRRVESVEPLVSSVMGVAGMVDADVGFDYLNGLPPDDPRWRDVPGAALVHDGYVYRLTRRKGYLSSVVHLSRVAVEDHLDLDALEYLTENGWVDDPEADRKVLMRNANSCRPYRNEYLGKWICVGNRMYSEGFVSAIQMHTSTDLEGPWEPSLVVEQARSWPGEPFSTYNAEHHPRFDKEGGRIFYSFGTRGATYNVNIYESHLDYVESTWSPRSADDDVGKTLRRRERTEIAVRMAGSSFSEADSVADATLRIPLRNRNKKDRQIRLSIDVGVPNRDGFVDSGGARKRTADVSSRQRLATAEIDVLVPEGAEEITTGGARLASLLDVALAHPAWIPNGEPNRLSLFIRRSDDLSWTPHVGRFDGGDPIELRMCHGACAGWRAGGGA